MGLEMGQGTCKIDTRLILLTQITTDLLAVATCLFPLTQSLLDTLEFLRTMYNQHVTLIE